MPKSKITTIGAAVQDVFLSGEALKPHNHHAKQVEEFPLGAKLELDDITFSTGGGATNAAVTFARQGQTVQFMGKIARDPAGAAVKSALEAEGIGLDLLTYSETHATGYSALLLAPTGERTILTYRGASNYYRPENFDLNRLESEWIYLSSLAGHIDILESIVDHAQKNDIKIAINPGKGELKAGERFKKLIQAFDIFIANKEEYEMLFGKNDHKSLLKQVSQDVEHAVLTDGPDGSWVTDGDSLYKAGMYDDVPVTDRTGAGDAFGSGFTSKVIAGESVERALTFASANSTSVVQFVGAKKGILKRDSELHGMEIEKTPL